ncbi:hypothetical protein TWF225_012098 [Orbilia oligospora]|nr:hypothetical protein TWF225_012098 [Orbilia oligospora]KAF3239684.1 hypothetical protein TWF217_012072 [Orbilia oligospora]KAF3261289.1 hypothetical protein TWF128_012079 [Orbilia oligospora]KAF3293340.1 hypothetical protein TWF132_012096 [Orbilia oligospora]
MVLARLEIGVSVLHRPGLTGWVLSPLQHESARGGRPLILLQGGVITSMITGGYEMHGHPAPHEDRLQLSKCDPSSSLASILVVHTNASTHAVLLITHGRGAVGPTGRSHFKARRNEEAGNECSHLSDWSVCVCNVEILLTIPAKVRRFVDAQMG